MEKLIKIAQKIGKKFTSNSCTEIYVKLLSDVFYRPMCLSLGGNDMVKLIFLIKGYGESKELTSFGNEIEKKLFTFSIIEVHGGDVEETCDICGGDGSVSCDDCSSGKNECSECDGDGKEGDGETCSSCDGDGYISCDYCDGDGFQSCDYCEGGGYIYNEDAANITTIYYTSIQPEVFNNIMLLEEFEVVSQNLHRFLKLDSFTFTYRTDDDETSESEIYENKGSNIFSEFNDNPEFVLNNNRKLALLDSGLN